MVRACGSHAGYEIYRILIGRPELKKKNSCGGWGVEWRLNITMDLEEIGNKVVDCILLTQGRFQWSCEHGNESLGSTKCGALFNGISYLSPPICINVFKRLVILSFSCMTLVRSNFVYSDNGLDFSSLPLLFCSFCQTIYTCHYRELPQ
jgi:hypothetical protein